MSDSLRHQIVAAIKTRLETIAIGNGYETNAGAHVFVWRETPLQETEIPGINIRDTEDIVQLTAGLENHTLTIELDLYVSQSSTVNVGEQMRKIVADVIEAIGVDVTWSGLAHDTRHLGEAVELEQNDRRLICARSGYSVLYTSLHFNPYL